MAATLTKRQREALIAIHTLTLRNGAGPTIREMRNALDVSSDQTIIEMLERLEKGGFISRDKRQARATSLTDSARLALGIVSGSSPTTESPMELDDQEQRVHDRLAEIDPRLARMYKGALSTLRSTTNEDRIAQSSHSLREIIDHLSNKGSAGMSSEVRGQIEKDKNTRRTIHGLRFYFDPQASIAVEQNPYKHLYDEYQTKLQTIAHHNENPDEAAYIELIKGLEYFLLRYVFPGQAEVYKLLEDTLRKGPGGVDAEDLRLLVKKNVESHRFFFKHADARWLPYLHEHGFLDASWETGEYLASIALDAPDGVLEVFLAAEMPKDAWGAKTAFSHAASKLPAVHAGKTVDKIVREEWVKEVRAALLHYKLRDLLKNLLDGKEYGPAAVLADAFFDVFPEEYGSYGSRKTRGYIGDYEYDQAVADITAVPAESVPPFLKVFASKLKKIMETVHARGEDGDDDYSYIWRPAIEEHSQNKSYDRIDDSIITGVRDLLEKRTTHLIATEGPDAARKELDAVLANDRAFPILSRFKLHIYRLFPETFGDEIEREVLTPPPSSTTWHEYSMLVHSRFPHLRPEIKEKYFELVDGLDKADDKYIDSRRARLVGLAHEGMGAAEKKKYARFLKLAAGIEQPFFLSYSGEATWVGPESPKNEEDLENKTVAEVLEVIKTWEPKGDQFFGPSRSGFGQVLRGVVAKDLEKYSSEASLFLDEAVRPVYIYNLFSGFTEGLKMGARMDWKQVMDLALGIVERSKNNDLSEVESDDKRDRLEADWNGAMQELARLIVQGLDTNSLPLKERARAWSVIEHLIENPDPTPEREDKYGGDNSDPYTMSINTVRGEAMHAVFAYIFWFNRAEKNAEPSWTAHIPDEAKKALEAHLDPKRDPSLAVRSVYGRFFPWMLSYGGDWAKDLIPTVFPLDDTDMRYAAWETYLSNLIFEETYKLLRPQYEMAADDIRKGRVPKRRYWVEVTQRLAEHAMIAYTFETDSKDNPFVEYFFASGNSSGKTRGMAVSLGGRAFISRDNTPAGEKTPRIEVLQKFWDWRLETSGSPSELREFGWWAKSGKFDDRWMLERLLRTVEKTKGDVDGEFIVMGSLEALVSDYPLLCAKIVKHIFASSNRRDRYTFLHMGELRTVLTKILQSKDSEAMKIARETIDYLLKLGFEDFRDLINL